MVGIADHVLRSSLAKMIHFVATNCLPRSSHLHLCECLFLMYDPLGFFFQPSMPVATLPQAVQTEAEGTHRMSKGDQEVHTAGLIEPLQPPARRLSQRQRPATSWSCKREQCQSHSLARRVRGQRVLQCVQEQWVRIKEY